MAFFGHALSAARTLTACLAVLLLFITSVAHGEVACTATEAKAMRVAAQRLLDKKDLTGALALLQAQEGKCSWDGVDESPLDYFWLKSDLALVLHKSGKDLECLRVLAPLLEPVDPRSLLRNNLADSRVADAISYNNDLCRRAYERRYAAFTSRPCTNDKGDQGVEVPGGCLLLMAAPTSYYELPRREDDDTYPEQICPRLVVARRGKRSLRLKVVDSDTDDPLTDISACCNIESSGLSVAVQGKSVRVRVLGGGHGCAGGSIIADEDAVYEWKGLRLRLLESNRIARH